MSVHNRTRLHAWRYLLKNGPSAPRDVMAAIGRSRHAVYNALHGLAEQGWLIASGVAPRDRRYAVAPGSTPPKPMRGQHPNSLRALAVHSGNGRRPLPPFGECALASLWSVSRADIAE